MRPNDMTALFAVLLTLCIGASGQQVRSVPSPAYPTIASAAMTAAPGTIVSIAAGVYHETLRDFGAPLVFEGAPGGGTIIEGGLVRRSFLLGNGSSLKDLHFRRGIDLGGACAEATGSLLMRDCSIRNCHAQLGNGPVLLVGGTFDIVACQFRNNTAMQAVMVLGQNTAQFSQLSRCLIKSNRGAQIVVFAQGGTASFDNSLVIDNEATGNLIDLDPAGTHAITHDTIIFNLAQNTISFLGSNPNAASVNSCIVRENTGGQGGVELDGPAAYRSNISGWGASNESFDIEPTFFNPQLGNFRLHPFSVSIDTGRFPVAIETVRDLDGFPRNVGPLTDQGCYEYGGPDPGPSFDGTAQTFLPQLGPSPMLRVNGSDGGRNHVVPVMAGQNLQISVQGPGLSSNVDFVLWGQFGFPNAFNPMAIPHTNAGLIVVTPHYLAPANPALFTLVDTMNPGNGFLPPTLAPWAFTSIATPVAAPFALQGIIKDAGGGWQITNCVVVFIGPS